MNNNFSKEQKFQNRFWQSNKRWLTFLLVLLFALSQNTSTILQAGISFSEDDKEIKSDILKEIIKDARAKVMPFKFATALNANLDAAFNDQSCADRPDGTPCSDGRNCTLNDKCYGGTCLSFEWDSCDDGVSCSADYCDAEADQCATDTTACDCASDSTCFVIPAIADTFTFRVLSHLAPGDEIREHLALEGPYPGPTSVWLEFNISEIELGYQEGVTKASIQMYRNKTHLKPTTTSAEIRINMNVSLWNQDTLTWNNAPAIGEFVGVVNAESLAGQSKSPITITLPVAAVAVINDYYDSGYETFTVVLSANAGSSIHDGYDSTEGAHAQEGTIPPRLLVTVGSKGEQGSESEEPSAGNEMCDAEGGACDGNMMDGGHGCLNNRDCDDGEFCNGSEICFGGICQHGFPPCPGTMRCDEINETCRFDECEEDWECQDRFRCNGEETCGDNGLCVKGQPLCGLVGRCDEETLACKPGGGGGGNYCPGGCPGGCPDDGNPCTKAVCERNGTEGCRCVQRKMTWNPDDPRWICDDGDECTRDDRCFIGECIPGVPINPDLFCNDNNGCTQNLCDPIEGCLNPPVPNGATCDDEISCTINDGCQNGECRGVPRDALCSDGNECTDDTCQPSIGDPETGCVHRVARGRSCDDENACTEIDRCQADGTCEGVPINVGRRCNDDNPCTFDECDPRVGCVNPPNNGASCSDNQWCTDNDHCSGGRCIGNRRACDDGDPCTRDYCEEHSGGHCHHDFIGECSRGNNL